MGASDELIARAISHAAREMKPDGDEGAGEKRHLEPAVQLAFAEEFGSECVKIGYKTPGGIPDWNPQPGGVDAVVLHADGSTRFGVELKVWKIDETLWDILKMASLARVEGVEATYVVAAATADKWSGGSDCVPLFHSTPPEGEAWYTEFFFEEYPKAWTNLLLGGPGRPTRVPRTIRLTLVTECLMPHFPKWSLRVLRVENERSRQWMLMDEWPSGYEPRIREFTRQISDKELTLADLPATDAEERAYHEFAMSTNGYVRMGNNQRCAAFANAAIGAWRQSGVLPDTIKELRVCLFFEQRRWHHFGDGFNDETAAYVHAIVAKLRMSLPTKS